MNVPAPRARGKLIVLYDADCGFCRWAAAWALRQDRRDLLVAAPIQSTLGSELLADLTPEERLAAAHVVGPDGRRRSGGEAASEVLGVLDRMRVLGRLARSFPRVSGCVYDAVAGRRNAIGRLVGRGARRRADRLLETASVATASELEARVQRLSG
jgi:predicted DCC family thiol-disulfide oxidoreductase YuxK